mgnify:CR=1 FL=1
MISHQEVYDIQEESSNAIESQKTNSNEKNGASSKETT